MILNILIGVVIIVVITYLSFLHAKNEAKRLRKGVHYRITWIRGGLFLVGALFTAWAFGFTFHRIASVFLLQWGVFTITFDQFYNFHKKHTALYMGSESLQDTHFKDTPIWLMVIDQVALYIGSVYYAYTILIEWFNY